MKTLNKALFALSLLIAFPAIKAMENGNGVTDAPEISTSNVEVQDNVTPVVLEVVETVQNETAPTAQSWIQFAAATGKQMWTCQTGNRYLQVGEAVVIISAAGVVSYKYNAKAKNAIDAAAAKAKVGYESVKTAGSSAVATVKAHPKKSAAGAAALAIAAYGAYYVSKNGLPTFGSKAQAIELVEVVNEEAGN